MSSRRLAALAAAVAMFGASCGAESDSSPSSPGTSTVVTIGERAAPAVATAAPVTTAPPITAVEEGAVATEPAERLDDDIVVAWIGGSELELDGRSLPDAVEARMPEVDGRKVRIDADAGIAPLPADVATSVGRAGGRNVDAIVVSMPPSWALWDGHDGCDGITPAHTFYACILEPRPETDLARLRADIAAMIAAVERSGVPAFVYVTPHSEESLANDALAARLAQSEAVYASLSPTVDRIEYVPTIITRDLTGLREGVEFFDMVHPTPAGIERLADFFTAEFARFLTANLSS